MWKTIGTIVGVVVGLALVALLISGIFAGTVHLVKAGANAWGSIWGPSAPVCEKVDGACTTREQLLVLQTEVKSGEKLGISKLMLEAQSAASVIVAEEKARLAEESFNRRAAELQAQTARLATIEAARASAPPPVRDPCANLRGRTREVCAGL